MRDYEKEFGLTQISSPDQNWGYNFSKEEIKFYGGREAAIEATKKDDAFVIRARIEAMWSKNKLKTMTEFVEALKGRGIDVKPRTKANGDICGISYKLETSDDKWISGSRVKSTRLTWNRLLKGENISYKPWRDNDALGLESPPKPTNQLMSVYLS